MKRTLIFILTLTLLGCGQQRDEETVNNEHPQNNSPENNNEYIVQKSGYNAEQHTDSTFMVGNEKYKVTIKNYTKGDYNIADTNENQITLYQEEYIDISINDKIVTISKSMFNDVYEDKNLLYHSGFGNAQIEYIDKENKKIFFSTYCGFHESDFGEMLYYSITFDGRYEFVKIEVPNEEEG